METAAITVRWTIDNVLKKLETGTPIQSETFDDGRWALRFKQDAVESDKSEKNYSIFLAHTVPVGLKDTGACRVYVVMRVESSTGSLLGHFTMTHTIPEGESWGRTSVVSAGDITKHCAEAGKLVVHCSVYSQERLWQPSIIPQLALDRRLARLFEDPTTDVVFRIRSHPRQQHERLLFAHRSVLQDISYFKKLLGPAFSEGNTTITFDALMRDTTRPTDAIDDDDSDEWLLVEEENEGSTQETRKSAGLAEREVEEFVGGNEDRSSVASHMNRTLRQVVVTDAGWITYRALIYWLYTHKLCLHESASNYLVQLNAPVAETTTDDLMSLDPPLTAESSESRRAWLLKRAAETGRWKRAQDVIEPASPHALYRLCDKLDVVELKELAKAAIIEGFTIQNVLYELVSTLSYHHDEIQDAARDFALANWDEVKLTPACQRVIAESGGGRIEGASEIWLKLLMKLTTGRPVAGSGPPTGSNT